MGVVVDELAEALQRWDGHLRRLRAEAGHDPQRERAMLEDLARYGGGPEKVGRLAGALARVARDGVFDDVRSRAGV
jgi:hypothetical protein